MSWREAFAVFVARLLRVQCTDLQVYELESANVAERPARPATELIVESVHPYLRFRVNTDIRFVVTRPDLANEQAWLIARSNIQRRAEEIGSRFPLTAVNRVYADLAAALIGRRPAGDTVVAWAHVTGVEVDADDLRLVTEYEAAQRAAQALRWSDDLDSYRMARYESLLTDPLRATAWVLATGQDRSQIDGLPATALALRELAAVLGSRRESPDEEPADSLSRTVDDCLDRSDPPGAALLHRQMVRLFDDHRREDLSDRVRRLACPNGNTTGDSAGTTGT